MARASRRLEMPQVQGEEGVFRADAGRLLRRQAQAEMSFPCMSGLRFRVRTKKNVPASCPGGNVFFLRLRVRLPYSAEPVVAGV